ncbi:hypothetical protein NLJ89_g6112 [Agrocybe chaxingu]|uniref:Uncharacterized protein n=1 Tax=Agrocybe chaxingu TaxID=84603 RepID=A0A9W8K1C2_9AGAR|nr:hypothetical protein NLJ89_g6112 [Agrocybe chaxingu]
MELGHAAASPCRWLSPIPHLNRNVNVNYGDDEGQAYSSPSPLQFCCGTVIFGPAAPLVPPNVHPPRRQAPLPASPDDTPPPNQKTALLAVTLSSNSFLDTTVAEEASNQTLYQIKTVGTSTTVSRVDRREGSVTAASIKWPRMLPLKTKGKEYSDGVLIQMRGSRWNGGETLLQPPVGHNSTRKFNIPDYPHPMKWKAYGNTYWAQSPFSTSQVVKTPPD